VAQDTKNVDRFFKAFRFKTVDSSSFTDFPPITGLGPSDTVDVSDAPMVTWTLQVVGDPAAATLWEVVLEGSVDGVNFSDILKHTTLVGDGVNLFSGTTLFLAKFYRVNTTVLTLGAATSITASVVGKQ
jgi:hypothetical protein